MSRWILVACVLVGLLAGGAVVAQEEEECEVGAAPSLSALSGLVEVTPEATPCLDPAGALDVSAYKGRIEAALMAGRFANALGEMTEIQRVVLPTIPDAFDQILTAYQAQLAANPDDLIALIGNGFAQWWVSDYAGAEATFTALLDQMQDSVYATLFRGSSRLFNGDSEAGEADVARALELAPDNADVHFIAADAYLYALGDLDRAFEQASLARDLGLVTPRVNAILATGYMAQGDEAQATQFFAEHLAAATSEYVELEPLAAGQSVTLDFVPGRAFRIPVTAEAGEMLSLITSSDDGVDTMAVLLTSTGELVTSNDDNVDLNAGIVRAVDAADTYLLVIGTFEGAGTGVVQLVRE